MTSTHVHARASELYMEILSETHANVSRDFISRIIFSRETFFSPCLGLKLKQLNRAETFFDVIVHRSWLLKHSLQLEEVLWNLCSRWKADLLKSVGRKTETRGAFKATNSESTEKQKLSTVKRFLSCCEYKCTQTPWDRCPRSTHPVPQVLLCLQLSRSPLSRISSES